MTSEQTEVETAARSQPGVTLRKAREVRGMSLKEVAAALNLSPVALQDLESGAFDRLPGHTFARGYIRAYAKLLGMDQELLVREFDQATGTDALGSSVNNLARISEPARVSQGLVRLVSFSVLAILLVAGFLWWQDSTREREDAAPGIEQVEVESADGTTQIHPLEPEDQAVELVQEDVLVPLQEATVTTGEAQSVTPVVAEAPPAVSAPIADAAVVPAPPAASPVPEPVVAPAVPAAAEVPAAQPVVGAGEGVLSIRFTANCWAQITDADGRVLLSALKRAGEEVSLAVKVPLELRLGYASGAQVSFNGKAVDIQPFLTGETARLKLGQ